MKTLTYLRKQHRATLDLLDELESVAAARRGVLTAELADCLVAHLAAEEQIFYPVARNLIDDPTCIDEGYEQHNRVKVALGRLLGAKEPAHFDARLKLLRDLFDGHVEEEEAELFPMFQRAFEDGDEDEDELLDQLQSVHDELLENGYAPALATALEGLQDDQKATETTDENKDKSTATAKRSRAKPQGRWEAR